jgi:hypothetical protein
MERIFKTLIMHKCNGKDLFVFIKKNTNKKNPNWANSNSLHIAYYLCINALERTIFKDKPELRKP